MKSASVYECAPLPVYGLAGMSLDENRELTGQSCVLNPLSKGDGGIIISFSRRCLILCARPARANCSRHFEHTL